jgi:hypothetical protein
MNKEHILQEIKRTVEANHGAPLGWRKFADETGIRDRDWVPASTNDARVTACL